MSTPSFSSSSVLSSSSFRTLTKLTVASLVLACTAALAGCGTYRVVRKTANGGEVALQGSPEKAREAAQGYMASQCPQGFDIVEEGEAVIGSETKAETQKQRVFGVPTTSTTAETTDKREWRIKYQCKGTVPAGSPAASAVPGGNQGSIHELVIRY